MIDVQLPVRINAPPTKTCRDPAGAPFMATFQKYASIFAPMMFPQRRSERSTITGLTGHRSSLCLPLFFSHLAAFFSRLIAGWQMEFLTIFYVLTES
ncbi:hypothetical protein [Pantoea dispersa]|uniref:hypothetical protein n=1 Tax=Pantoea dispersa TaxID=59814 RepID=UPI0021C57F44|nr:hypothetical protein [Pantoea dispersa]